METGKEISLLQVLVLDSDDASAEALIENLKAVDLYKVRAKSVGTMEDAQALLEAVVFDVILIAEKFLEENGLNVIEVFSKRAPVALVAADLLNPYSKMREVADQIYDCIGEKDLIPAVLARSLLYMQTQSQFVEEKKRLNEEIQHSQKVELIGQLSSGIIHDFNNKLAIISANIMRAVMRVGEDSDVAGLLMRAQGAIKEASTLVRELLRFSRKGEPDRQELHFESSVEKIVKQLKGIVGSRIELCYAGEGLDNSIEVVPSHLDQIVMNLVLNARDAISDSGTIRVHTGQENGSVFLRVQDDGCGMSPARVDHIFEPFYTTKGSEKGTGLGLSIVHRLVKEMGAEISVESILGQGTTFQVVWPCNNENHSSAA